MGDRPGDVDERAARRLPFSTIRTAPVCSMTNSRPDPSRALVTPNGADSPSTTSTNPRWIRDGTTAALVAAGTPRARAMAMAARRGTRGMSDIYRRGWVMPSSQGHLPRNRHGHRVPSRDAGGLPAADRHARPRPRGWQRPGPTPALPGRDAVVAGGGAGRAAARDTFGIDVTILRLLETELPSAHGGAVTYLAEVDAVPRAGAGDRFPPRAVERDLDRRSPPSPYARPGGPAADLAWADRVLAAARSTADGPAEQVRTWNLSSLWRLPTERRRRLAQGRAAILRARGRAARAARR